MIVLLSGCGKFSIDDESIDFIIEEGSRLFSLLSENKFEEFSLALKNLHEFIKKIGKPVSILKNADIVIPPIDINPEDFKNILGL
ncbi:MAG: hypothetical protein QXW62_02080 [Candidatus Methanomethylicaceae archaeon]|nr:hypothetical protein [Candidatus Verstraetearchaeota archaeon]